MLDDASAYMRMHILAVYAAPGGRASERNLRAKATYNPEHFRQTFAARFGQVREAPLGDENVLFVGQVRR